MAADLAAHDYSGDGDNDVTAPCDLGGERLHLAEGVELLGRYQGSGLKDAPFLIRRADGQVIQVTELIYLVATCLAANYHLHQIATRVTEEFGRAVSVENVAYLVNQKLRPSGLVDAGHSTRSPRADALLSLRLRVPVVPARIHGAMTRLFLPLFVAPVVVLGLLGLVATDTWLVLSQRDELATGLREIIYQPHLVLLVTALTLVAGAFHETGHATAARFGGATPGAMGAGVYLVWPVFYTDVTDSYRLSRIGRLRTDLGGVYFNVLFALGITGVYLATGFTPLLVMLVLGQIETLRQFLPFVRLDGYYVVSDLAGVPNLFAYMQPVLVATIKRRDAVARAAADAKLADLTPSARRIVKLWVSVTAPVLVVNCVMLLVLLPRLAGLAWGSAGGQWRQVTGADGFSVLAAVNGFVGLCLLALPIVGMLYVASRLAGRLVVAGQSWWRARPSTTAFVTAAVGVALAWNIGFVWPDAFASALLQAQQATSPVGAPAVADSESAGSASASGGDLIGSQMSVSSTTAAHRAGPTSTKPPMTVTTLPSSSSTDPSTTGSQLPGTTADDEPHQAGGARATPGTTAAPSTNPHPTTTNPNLLADLISALFPKP